MVIKFIRKNIFFSLSFLFFLTFLNPSVAKASVLLPGPINSCGELAVSGLYTLTSNVSNGSSTCFVITADNVIIDGWGFTVSGTGSVAIDGRGVAEGSDAVTNLIVNDLNISGYTTGINLSGSNDTTGLGENYGFAGSGGDVAVYYSTIGSILVNGGNSSTQFYGGEGGNISLNGINLDISNKTLSALGGNGTLGKYYDGGLYLNYTGTLTKTNVVLSSLSFFDDNTTSYGVYVGGTWPILPGNVSACGTLYGPGIFTLTGSISNITGTCFNIATNDVTLNGAGYTLTASSSNTSYAINANNFSNFVLASTTVSTYTKLITSSSTVSITGNAVNLSNKTVTASSVYLDSTTLNLATTTFITSRMDINYSTSVAGTSTATSTALTSLRVNNIDYGARSAGLIFSEAWTSRIYSSSGYWAVASSYDGRRLVASNGLGGYLGYIYTSTDGGASWSTSTAAGNRYWTSVACDAYCMRIVATVGGPGSMYDGQIYTSYDGGTTWTARDSSRSWSTVKESTDGKVMVAVGLSNVYISTDSGVNWAYRPDIGNRSWSGLAVDSTGSKIFAVYWGGLYYSYDYGNTWATSTSAGTRSWNTISSSADGTRLVAGVYNGRLYYSSDSGITWATSTSPSGNWQSITSSADGSKVTAVVNGGDLYTSTDYGATWVLQSGAGYKSWTSVASSADGNKIFAGTGNYAYTYTSFTPTFLVNIILPLANSVYSSWNPLISWGISKNCYYSYDNFVSTSTANCSSNGSDISPSATGSTTLYVKGISAAGTVITKSVAFNNDQGGRTILFTVPKLNGNYDATNWKPSVNYSTTNASLSLCQYSYDNFVTNNTVACSNNGSDILPPSDGYKTLYIKTTDTNNNINTNSVSFTYGSHFYERAASRYWSSVASDSTGTKLVATVGSTGGTSYNGQIYTSTDSGLTWTARDSSRSWRKVTSSADGTKLAAVENGGYIYTSTTTGVTWVQRTSIGRNWTSIASDSTGNKLIASVTSGYIYTSTDAGITWATSTTAGIKSWIAVTSSSDGTKLAAAENNGYIYISTDSGATWATSTASGSRNWYSMASDSTGTKLVAGVGGGYIYTTTDSGATWTARTFAGTRSWNSVTSSADGTKLGAASDLLFTSFDGGVNWVKRESTRNWSTILISSDGNKLVAAVGAAYTAGYIYTSDLVSDSYVNSYMSINNPTASANLNPLSWAPSVNWGFNKSSCFYSYNNWTSTSTANCLLNGSDILAPLVSGAYTLYLRAFDLSNNLSSSSVAFSYYLNGWNRGTVSKNWQKMASDLSLNKVVAAVSNPGYTYDYINTSADGGVTWVERTSAGKRYWTSVTSSADGSKIAAGTYDDYIYTSTDGGVNWVQRASSFGIKRWYSITSSADGVKLAATAYGSYIYISSDSGSTWATSTGSVSLGVKNWYSITSSADGTKLAAAVKNGYIYTSSDSGVTWATSTASGSKYWSSITMSKDASRLVAVVGDYTGSSGQIYVSTDFGTSWTAYGATSYWGSVASSVDGMRLITGLYSGATTGYIYFSNDGGLTWATSTDSLSISESWRTLTASGDGTKFLASSYGSGSYTYSLTKNPRVLYVDILLPSSNSVLTSWTPIVSWGSATSCYYSYNNFSSTSTANCASYGGDILPPSSSGSNTLYIKAVDASSTVATSSKTFIYSPHYWCGTADSNWSNVSNWYTDSNCNVNIGSLPATTSAAFLVGSVSPIISSATTTIPVLINSTGLTGAANTSGIIFSNNSFNTAKIVGNATFNNSAYNMGDISGNAIFSIATSGTYTLSATMKWGGTISGTIKGGDLVDITHLIFNNSSSNETTIPSNFSTVFNHSASNHGIINGDATFNNTGLFTMGTVNGTSTLNGFSQVLNGVNNVVNLVKKVATAVRDTLYIATGSTVNVSGVTDISGYDQNNLLSIKTTTPGSLAFLNVIGSAVMDFFRIRDIHNTFSNINLSLKTIFDDGGNTGFTFKSGSSLSERNGMTSSYLSDGEPIFPGEISTCGVLNFAGTYTLSSDITNASGAPCFVVRVNGVTVDGNNHTVTATGVNNSYAVVATSADLDGGSAYGTTTIQNITFTGFAGGINATGNNATTNGNNGGNGGEVFVTNSNLGSVNVSGGNGLGAGSHGYGATATISNSTTGNVSSIGTNGTINISGTNVDLSNLTLTASSTLSVSSSASLTTTNTILSPLTHFIAQSVDHGSYVGGEFPIFPGTINSCGNMYFAGTYVLANDLTGNCNVLSNGVIIEGNGNTLNGNIVANNFGITISNVDVSGDVSSTDGSIVINSVANILGTTTVADVLSGDGTGTLGNTVINADASVATSSVIFLADVINNGTINPGNTVVGSTFNNSIINGGFVFNASSTNSGVVNGDVVLNNLSTNTGTINGNSTLNNLAINSGTISGTTTLNNNALNTGTVGSDLIFNTLVSASGSVSFASSTVFLGTGHVNGLVKDSLLNEITDWVFNDLSSNTGFTKGDAHYYGFSYNNGTLAGHAYFNEYSTNTGGTVNGDADIYYPVSNPIGGTITGTVTYHPYPDAVSFINAVDNMWNNPLNWFTDTTFSESLGRIPSDNESVIIFASTTLASDIINDIYIAVGSTTINGANHKITGDIKGNGAYDGHPAYNFNISNVIVNGTTTAIGGDGIPGHTDGGKGGTIRVHTSATGLISVNGGDPEHNGGDAGEIIMVNSYALVPGTKILAVGGDSTGCGFGGSGGDISLVDSSGYELITAKGADATTTCVVIPPEPTSRTSGRTSKVGVYTPPSTVTEKTTLPNSLGTNSLTKFIRGIINTISLPVQQLKPLELKILPKFGTDEKGSFSFIASIKNFLFAPLPKSYSDSLKSADGLEEYLKKIGISNSRELLNIQSKPIALPSDSKSVIGIWEVYSKGLPFINTLNKFETGQNIPIPAKITGTKENLIFEKVTVSPGATFTLSLRSPMNVGAKVEFNGKVYELKKEGDKLITTVTAPKKIGTYTIKSDATPLELKVEVVGEAKYFTVDTGTEKVGWWSKIKSFFGF